MDSQMYSRLLSYILCELTMPVKKHIYNFIANNEMSINHNFLAMTSAVSKSSKPHRRLKPQKKCSGLQKNDNFKKYKDSYRHNAKSKHRVGLILRNHKNPQLKNIYYKRPNLKNENNENTGEISGDKDQMFVQEKLQDMTNEASTFEANKIEIEEGCRVEYGETTIGTEEGVQAIKTDVTEHFTNTEDSQDDMYNNISGFYSDPLLLCSDEDFKTMFRMTRTSFQKLLTFMSHEEMELIENVPLYKKVLIVLWLMGNSGSYSDAAQVFSVSEETAANCFFDVCATLYNRSDNVIKWPTASERSEIALRIEKNYGFPGVVGILGCHYFSITIPKEILSRREHFNAKHRTYSVALQIVCDDMLVIRDIFPGLPGSTPEAQVLRESPLCEQLMSKSQPHQLVESHKHLLARSDYPQLTSMLTPYKKETLAVDESEFNELHENVCQLVDQTFQMLQERFLTLKLLDPEVATMVLVAACALHNICIENNDLFES